MILLKFLAALLFAIAVVVAWGSGSIEHSAVLVPAGLLCWVLSECPAPNWRR